jgi:hypothetical protein
LQLQQKEDANLDLMAQQIKASQIAQLLRDDRDAIEMKMAALQVGDTHWPPDQVLFSFTT